MNRVALIASTAMLLVSGVYAGDPLKGASYRELISGPRLEPGALEGKVVLLEYFGYR
jgi:hypothetical protein